MNFEYCAEINADDEIYKIGERVFLFLGKYDIVTAKINGYRDGFLQVYLYNVGVNVEIPTEVITKIYKI